MSGNVIDILAINETRLSNEISSDSVRIPGYEFIRKDRNRNTLNITERKDVDTGTIEAICIEVKKPKAKAFAILASYRPPGSQDSHFFQTIETAIAKLDSEDKEVIIIGDLNCNFLAARPDRNTENLKSIIEVYQMKQLISEPTRLTESSQTLIDVILTNKPNRIVSSGVLHVSISDHSLIYTVRKISVPTQNNHKYQSMRSFKKFNSDSFRNDLKNQSWNTLLMINDPNEMWKAWKEMFLPVADKHAPLKLKRIKNKPSPWITTKVKNLMNKRDNLKRVAVRSKNSQAWVDYKKARNSVNNAIKTTKAAYYNAQFDKHSGNPKETWKVIREIQGKTKKAATIGQINTNGMNKTTAENPQDIANILNTHFIEIGPKLASSQSQPTKPFNEYFKHRVNSIFKLCPIDRNDVLRLLCNLSTNKATGLDGISCQLLKEAAPVIADSLCHLFNNSINTRIFPEEWKLAKVFPLHKGDTKTNPNNYRPISVIPAIAKVFERLVYDQLYCYLIENKLINKYQSGFRSLHSTVTALLDATNEWYINIDKDLITSVTFLDLAKAFDTVDHNILLQKLSFYGSDQDTLSWFFSYLSDRKQKCCVNGVLSDSGIITCGVPQGSILGPLLFLLYINDLPCCLNQAKTRMFADDTNISVTGACFKEVQESVNSKLEILRDWLTANKLSINVTKTEYMLIASKHRITNLIQPLSIKLGNDQVKRVTASKTLGMYIDEDLSWDEHVDYVARKISAIGGLKQVRPFVKQETLFTIYKSLILPHFDYCDVVWDTLNKGLAQRLQKLQNRSARVITSSSYEIRSKDILKQLGWETLHERRFAHTATMMYRTLNGQAPLYLKEKYTRLCDKTKYDLRNGETNLAIPKPRTESFKKSFEYRGARVWNALPTEAKAASSLNCFKQMLESTSSFSANTFR